MNALSWLTPMIMKQLMWINFGWYLLLTIGFALTRTWSLAVYWLGVTIITLGAIIMARRIS